MAGGHKSTCLCSVERNPPHHLSVALALRSLQKCLKILPYVGGVLLAIFLLFAYYVRTLPPPTPKVQPQKLDVKSVPKKEEGIKPVEDEFPEQLLQDLKKDEDSL